MMKPITKTLATAPTRERITAYVNEYYYSENYEVLEDGTIHNTKTGRTIDNARVVPWRNGYKFVRIQEA